MTNPQGWPMLAVVLAMAGPAAAQDGDFFESKVRPILVEHCLSCHSAESKPLRGGLRLDSRAGWEKGGDSGPAIAPGDPDNSLLIEAVRYEDPAMQMPPKGKLPEAQVAALVDWVRRGAPDPRTGPAAKPASAKVIDIEQGKQHWAFRPLKLGGPPPGGAPHPIDRFLAARLSEKGITPNPPADRRTLIRRATLDLTGLPPDPDEVDRFVADADPEAFSRRVDRLLDSPRYGERWARHWLDLARWGESHGFEHDYDRPTAYTYRDFVIEALNRDLPYDTFVKWQLAGDEIAPDDNLALKATGFLAAGTHSTQITASQVEKERYDELDDMLNTTSTAFLGLTVGCARCHDHKYDPIPARDYYRMLSTFTTTVRSEYELKLDPEGDRKARERYEAEHAPYVAALDAFEKGELASRMARWESTRSAQANPPEWVVLEPSKVTSKGGATFAKQADGSYLATGTNAEFDTYTIVAACDMPRITAVRVEALADPSLPHQGPGRAGNGNFALSDFKLKIGPRYGIGRTFDADLVNPKATFEQKGLPVAATIDGDAKSAWAVDPQFGKDHAAVYELLADVLPDGGATLTFTLDFRNNGGHNIGRIRVSATSAPPPVGIDGDGLPAGVRTTLELPREKRTDAQQAEALAWYKTIDPEWRSLKKALDDHARTEPKATVAKALISSEGVPAVRLHTQGGDFLDKTHFLKRGDPNQKLDEASQGFLQVLMAQPESHWRESPPEGWRTSYRRKGMANWITDTDQGAGALLARVIVNRLWQHHMGRGIVATPSDFGKQGEPPSHPELLDWLAVELIHNGWHLKPIHRLIMTSEAYQRSSAIDPAREKADPDNALGWRFARRRLEAEPIRDSMLAVAGKLDARMYGPGTLDERMTRRSIYFTVKRSRLIPMMAAFDAPDALVPLAGRAETTVAPQSLFLMNSPVVREWASAFARRIAPKPGQGIGEAVAQAYRIALGRMPTEEERSDAIGFIEGQAERYKKAGGDGIEPSLTDFCLVVMGLNEFLFVE
ncbi:MAG: PSD1 and planctomycete cytochrome C domain-containing protein [Isosphaeraceae bacterium]